MMLSRMVFPASGLATGQTLFSAMRVNHHGVHIGKRRCREVEFPRGRQRLWVIQTCHPQVHTGDASADAHTVPSFFEAIPCLGAAPPLIPACVDLPTGAGAAPPLAPWLQIPLRGWMGEG